MDAKGLMIGNYLKNGGVVVKIDARSIFDMFNYNPKYTPIPLTEEWLLKFGFEKPLENVYTLGRMQVEIYANMIIVMVNDNENDTVMEMEFENYYVHQLQNLYYALTVEELTV